MCVHIIEPCWGELVCLFITICPNAFACMEVESVGIGKALTLNS